MKCVTNVVQREKFSSSPLFNPDKKLYLLNSQRKMGRRACEKWTGAIVLYLLTVCVSAGFIRSNTNETKEYMTSWQNRNKDVSALRSRVDWEEEGVPEICKQVIEFPQPNTKNCSTAPIVKGAPKCNPRKAMMFSQYGEDYYLYTRHFSKLNRPGVYLDIAANE